MTLRLRYLVLTLAPLTAGEFAMQVRKFYATGPACCVAVGPGGVVYAGTDKGLVAFRNGGWASVPGAPAEAVQALAANGQAVAVIAGGKVYVQAGGAWSVLETVVPRNAKLALNGVKPVIKGARGVAVGPEGVVAVAAEDGLFEGDRRLYPRQGSRSWAPRDVPAVAYDGEGRLYFASPQGVGIRSGEGWRLYTTDDGLPYDDFTAVAPAADGSVWFGTRIGAIHFDGQHWEYREGRRWLPNDDVRSIFVSGNAVWFATADGVGVIETQRTTLAAKARFFEDEIDKRHRRTEYGYVLGVHVRAPGDAREWTQSDSDNDGLWTSMYGAGECFACAASGDEQACRRAATAFEALRFLGAVTQGGDHPAPRGFVARAILPTSGPNPNLEDSPEHDQRQRSSDPLWKTMRPRWPVSADGKWYWKSDTSSDELDGHYFFYARYYDLAARTDAQKRRVREQVAAITDHLIDHGFQLVDHDGQVTRWGVFNPENLNHSPNWWGDRSLNSTSILSYLRVAEHVTGDAKYARAYRNLIEQHSYAMNVMIPKDNAGPGAGNQSDDEMAFMCYYNLLKYETDPQLREMYGYALRRRWEIERPELCPLFNFIAAASIELQGAWREESIDTLQRYPLDRFNWALKNSHRKDVVSLPEYANDESSHPKRGHRKDGFVLPIDERFVDQWNHDPWQLDYAGDGRYLADGASFLLPYYMGLYHKFGVD
jgi:hypothetical protein